MVFTTFRHNLVLLSWAEIRLQSIWDVYFMFQRHNGNIEQYLIFIFNWTYCFISLENTLPIARANMLVYTKKTVTVAVVILMTIALCSADIQEVRTQFVKNKLLSTSYATKLHISKLNCVQWCSRDRQMGKCKIAGYSKTCCLSMDNPEDALQVDDEMAGVFFIGKFLCFIRIVIINNLMYLYVHFRTAFILFWV